MPDFTGMLSFIAALTALFCGIAFAIVLAIGGNWWGLLAVPLMPLGAVAGVKLWLGSDA